MPVHTLPMGNKLPREATRFMEMPLWKLERQVKLCWTRFSKDLRTHMSPRLYYLRLRYRKQGSRHGLGFINWLEANDIGLSRSTANRWADDYAIAIGKMKPRKSTSPHLRQSGNGGNNHGDGQHSIPIVLPEKQWAELQKAMDRLEGVDVSQVIYDTIMEMARATRKKPVRRAA